LTLSKQQPRPQAKKTVKTKKRVHQNITSAVAHVKASFNNTIIAITDPSGRVISWASAGSSNFKGSRKSSAFAATVAAQNAGKAAQSAGVKEVEVLLNGPGAGRESAVRGLQTLFAITAIRDKTPVKFNGCRPRKRRRV
jgi:small subunit ribosomal protein S11